MEPHPGYSLEDTVKQFTQQHDRATVAMLLKSLLKRHACSSVCKEGQRRLGEGNVVFLEPK